MVLRSSGLLELLPDTTLMLVTGLYGDESRHYHDFDHAIEVLSWVNRVLEDTLEEELAPFTARELRLAALFHDIVYGVEGSPTNEQKSCEMFQQLLGSLMPSDAVDRVCQLILFTAQHGKFETEDVPLAGRLLLDADISSLGQQRWEVFLYNNENVVAELKQKYTDEQIAVGRRAFFHGMLNKKSIFLSEWFQVRFEEQARRNLTRISSE